MSSPLANSNLPLSHPQEKETLQDDGSPPLPPFLPRPKTLLSKEEYKPLLVGLVDECKKHAVYDFSQGSDTDKNNAWNKSMHDFFHPLYGAARGFRCAGGDEPVKEFKRMVVHELWPQFSQVIGDKHIKNPKCNDEEYEIEAMKQYCTWVENEEVLKARKDKEQREKEEHEKGMRHVELAAGAMPVGAYGTPQFSNLAPVRRSLNNENEVTPTSAGRTQQSQPEHHPNTAGTANLSPTAFQHYNDINNIFNIENMKNMAEEMASTFFSKRMHDGNTNSDDEDTKTKRLKRYMESYKFHDSVGNKERVKAYEKKIAALEAELDQI